MDGEVQSKEKTEKSKSGIANESFDVQTKIKCDEKISLSKTSVKSY